jgi:uncharacterized protein
MRSFIYALILASLGLVASSLVTPDHPRAAGQIAMAQEATALLPAPAEALALIAAAEAQVGVVTTYDPAYVALDFPGGDVPADRGVCTDVVIRALRQAHGIDLQSAINRDMKANFADYPANWGLKTTDRNIDHRRVPNQMRLLHRLGAAVEGPFLPGDVVTSVLPGNLPHVMIVTNRAGVNPDAPLIVHNIGAGTRVEDRLTGHFRLTPDVLARLRALQD